MKIRGILGTVVIGVLLGVTYCREEKAENAVVDDVANTSGQKSKMTVVDYENEEAKGKQTETENKEENKEALNEIINKIAKEAAEDVLKKASENGEVDVSSKELLESTTEMAKKLIEDAVEGKEVPGKTIEEAVENLQKKLKEKEEAPKKEEKIEGKCILFTESKLTEEEVEKIDSFLKVSFEVSADAEAAKELGATMPGLYYKSGEGAYTFTVTDESAEGLTARIKDAQTIGLLPVFGELHKDNSHMYEHLSVPIVYFIAKKDDFEKHGWAAPIAESLKSDLKVALLDYVSTEFFLNLSGVHENMLPALFMISQKKNKMYKYLLPNAEDNARTIEFLTKCAYDIESLPPYLMGEPRPSDAEMVNEAGVTTVVTSTFDEVALNPVKDTLVVYYAEWCKFCQKLVPGLDDLARALKGVSSDVVVAKMLMSKNDIPMYEELAPIHAYPTIRLYKKGTNQEVEFEIRDKPADAESILEFLKKHADIPADLVLDAPQAEKTETQMPEEIKMDL